MSNKKYDFVGVNLTQGQVALLEKLSKYTGMDRSILIRNILDASLPKMVEKSEGEYLIKKQHGLVI